MLVLLRAARSFGLGTLWLREAEMNDNDDYTLIDEVVHYGTIIFLVLMTITFFGVIAGFLWGML
jgi:hypothetical protein